jgi:hypothetical protein
MLTSVEPSSAFNSGDTAPQSTQVKRWPIMAPSTVLPPCRRREKTKEEQEQPARPTAKRICVVE